MYYPYFGNFYSDIVALCACLNVRKYLKVKDFVHIVVKKLIINLKKKHKNQVKNKCRAKIITIDAKVNNKQKREIYLT